MINVDISNIWGEISLSDLLAAEKEVFDAHFALGEGTGLGQESLGWLELAAGETERILQAAQRIRESSRVLIVLGTDSSCLGARGVIELLQGMDRNLTRGEGDPQIFFAGNSLSTRRWNELTKLLEGKEFSLCVVSASGEDLEPAIALRGLKWMLERRYGTDEARKRIYAVTGEQGALRKMAEEGNWETFSIPGNVSAGFSLLSPAGLLPMAVAGIDIGAVLRGAEEARESFDLRSFENPVWLYAAVRHLLQRSGKTIELLESFEPGFQSLARWWQILFSAAEGKAGKGIFPTAGLLTADLYSLGQMVQEGQRNLFETMIRFDAPQQGIVIGEDVKNLDGLNYLAGKTMDCLEDQVCQSIVDVHADAGVPVISIDCGELCEESVGELIWFFQLSCAISAYMLGVNPFAQPGAEQCRQAIFAGLGRPAPEEM